MALGEELVFEPAPEELQDVGLRLFGGALQKPAEDGEALVDQGVERKRVALLEDDVDDAEGLAAQGIGIGCSGRDQADAEEAADRIQFVGDADDGPLVGIGEISTRGDGKIMFVDRLCDDRILFPRAGRIHAP